MNDGLILKIKMDRIEGQAAHIKFFNEVLSFHVEGSLEPIMWSLFFHTPQFLRVFLANGRNYVPP